MKVLVSNILILVLIVLVFIGCKYSAMQATNKVGSQEEFSEWVSDNSDKLVKVREMNEIYYSLQYVPISSTVKQVFSFNLRIYSKRDRNLLKIPNHKFNTDDAKMMFWSSGIRKYLKLITDKDTIPCAIVVFENSGGLANSITINIGFSTEKISHSQYTLVYDDIYFGSGKLNFLLDSIIESVPIIEQT